MSNKFSRFMKQQETNWQVKAKEKAEAARARAGVVPGGAQVRVEP